MSRAWETHWDQMPVMVFVGLNPSTADAHQDDPTIRKCIGYAHRNGCGWMIILNLFAWRSTDPAGLLTAEDPVGPSNDDILHESIAGQRALIVAAWGGSVPKTRAVCRDRPAIVLNILRRYGEVYCLGKTEKGIPRHPLYLRSSQPLEVYKPQWLSVEM